MTDMGRARKICQDESWSGVLGGIDAEFLHARQQCGPVEAHARGSSSGAADASPALGKGLLDFLALFLRSLGY
jgi:hypothetical protein